MALLPPIAAPETVLVVDDHASVLAGVSFILKNAGFRVLSVSTPEEAIQVSSDFAGPIHLLLTDVRMRGMSGADLAKTLMEQRTQLRVMMMTGYAGGDLLVLNFQQMRDAGVPSLAFSFLVHALFGGRIAGETDSIELAGAEPAATGMLSQLKH